LRRSTGSPVTAEGASSARGAGVVALRAPRIALYQPWTANMDEGWTRWVLEQHGFPYTTLHNADVRAGTLRPRFDAIILPDQAPRDILEGYDFKTIRPSTAAASARRASRRSRRSSARVARSSRSGRRATS